MARGAFMPEPAGSADPTACGSNNRIAAYTFGYKIGEEERQARAICGRAFFKAPLRNRATSRRDSGYAHRY